MSSELSDAVVALEIFIC